MSDITTLSATEIAAAVRGGTLSAAAVTDAFLARIAAVDPQVGAFLTVTADAARNAAALSDGMGHNDSTVGVRRAPMAAESPIMTTIQVTVRAAMGPARAASALLTIPVTTNATTKGTTVIRSPFSHIVPTISRIRSSFSPTAGNCAVTKMPRARPMTRARRIRVAFDIAWGLASPLLPMQGRAVAVRKITM